MRTFFRLTLIVCIVIGFTSTDCQAKYRLTVENGGNRGYFYQLMRNCFGNLFSKKVDFESLRYTGKGQDTFIWGRTKDYNELSESTLGDKAIECNINDNDREAADYAIAQIKKGVNTGSKTMQSGRYVWWNKTNLEITVSVD